MIYHNDHDPIRVRTSFEGIESIEELEPKTAPQSSSSFMN